MPSRFTAVFMPGFSTDQTGAEGKKKIRVFLLLPSAPQRFMFLLFLGQTRPISFFRRGPRGKLSLFFRYDPVYAGRLVLLQHARQITFRGLRAGKNSIFEFVFHIRAGPDFRFYRLGVKGEA
jgi:hypothetical protein